MKRNLLLLNLLLPIVMLSQSLSTSTTDYTVPQLVNDVLINSPCSSATNITWSTGTNFGSTNGIGYFQNSNNSFPITSGVILSTGNVLNAGGPNTSLLNDGSDSWTGDSDLEATMANAGISMVTKNATILEFDFIPISDYFSFDFIFASEEYGNYQCDYSDAFAFLLTNTTTNTTTNLAVVPNTTTPISVTTIRNYLYNSSCPSVNPQYFDNLNGTNSAINYNGQTVIMKATSTLIPGVKYHIKLVIADRLDYKSDSAIFIPSSTFNIGQEVLGKDLTIENNNAVCYGESHVLDTGLNPAIYTFEWKKNNLILQDEMNPSITIDSPGEYSVTYTNTITQCEAVTDIITVEYYPVIKTSDPKNIYKCNIGATSYTFNLEINTNIVKKNIDPLASVSFHKTLDDANNNINPLNLNYNSPGNEIIYVRIELPNMSCFIVKSFQLLLTAPPIAYKPLDMEKCSKAGETTAVFNINSQTHLVMNGQSPNIYSVSYYNSLNDATNAINPLSDLSNGSHGTKTVHVRIQNDDDPSCYSLTSFEIVVNPGPAPEKPEDVFVCTQYVLPALTEGEYFTESGGMGTQLYEGDVITETQRIYIYVRPKGQSTCTAQTSFQVYILTGDDFLPKDVFACTSYTLPEPLIGNYYTAPGGMGIIIEPGTKITSSQAIYYYYKTTSPPLCEIDADFYVNITPGINLEPFKTIFECTSYTLPTLSIGNYYTEPNGKGTIIPAETVLTTSQTIYVYAISDGPTQCVFSDSFDVYIGMVQPENITQCNDYILPTLPVGNYYTEPKGGGELIPGGTIISKNSIIFIYAPTETDGSNCTDNMFFTITIFQPIVDQLENVSSCESYVLPAINNGEYYTNSVGSGDKLNPGDIVTESQTIYIFKRLNDTCYNETSFEVSINKTPIIDIRTDIDTCHLYELTSLSNGNYFTGPNGTGTLLPAGTIINKSQRIYIYIPAYTEFECSAEGSFNVNIYPSPAEILDNIITCNQFVLPVLPAENKYYTESGGPDGGGVQLNPGTAITVNSTIYIYKSNTIRSGFTCSDESSFTITIIESPVANPVSDRETTICDTDGKNDGIYQFDLKSISDIVLGIQTQSYYTIKYYSSMADAANEINEINHSSSSIVYVRVNNTLGTNCYDIQPITIKINKLPDPKTADGTICLDDKTGEVIKPYYINTGLSPSLYSFLWTKNSESIVGTNNFYKAISPGTYSLETTDRITGCTSLIENINVGVSQKPIITAEVNYDFSEDQSIVVTASGVGDSFEYQLDGGLFQDEPVFENVVSGIHHILVNDKKGCGSTSLEVMAINYPRYFTPNNDGIHDTWNIPTLSGQKEAAIVIYNRFGKIIKQIKPSETGWDGTYNGEEMPSDDYWFSISYLDENQYNKEFRAHFSLKR